MCSAAGRLQTDVKCEGRHCRRSFGRDRRLLRHDAFRGNGGGNSARHGRSQTAFSEGGLPVGAGLEDLGKGLRSQVGTMFSTKAKGVRYMEMAEGYVLKMALDENDEVIGYQFVKLGKMLEDIRHGMSPDEAYKKNIGQYGRFDGAAKYVDPREE